MTDIRNPLIERAIASGGGSQAELARRCKCAQQHISKLLNGEATITPPMAIAIARATNGNVRVADLLPELVDAIVAELGLSRVSCGRSSGVEAAA